MKTRVNLLPLAAISAAALPVGCAQQGETASTERPNVIVVLCDDLGSADVGFGGCHDIPTPNIDRIAYEGVSFTNAYISAPYSGPSRCGLNTGRYQQRFGGEENMEEHTVAVENHFGVPRTELMLPEMMKQQGYKTAVLGKWHMGDAPELAPNERGADYFYGFTGGGFSYWGINTDKKNPGKQIMENTTVVPPSKTTYLTDDLSDKAVDFINANKDENFYIYLAYNAPHSPFHAPQKYLDRTKHISNAWRSVYAAMILAVDDGVGRIWDALEKNGIEDNTMIIFLSDNGGTYQAENRPRRAFKGNMYQGGTSTPFAIYWKGHIRPGTEYDKVMSSLDIFPTVATAAGVDVSKLKNPLDGVDLMPYLSGKNSGTPHEQLCWRVAGGFEWAIRKGDYKLVKRYYSDIPELYNVVADPIEMTDVAAQNPAIVADMKASYDEWNSEMIPPVWHDAHKEHQIIDYEEWDSIRRKALPPASNQLSSTNSKPMKSLQAPKAKPAKKAKK